MTLRILVTDSRDLGDLAPHIDLSTPCIPPPLGAFNNGNGYYRFRDTGEYVHRVAYREHVGPIPDELEIDHVCHSAAVDQCPGGDTCPHRSCRNPAHLEAVTSTVNILRSGSPPAENARKERCDCGLEYVTDSRGRRRCELCRRLTRQATGEISALGRKADRKSCPQGHEYTPENTYVAKGRSGPQRMCRKCNADRARARRAARRRGRAA